jgi:hypothetical protein
MPMKYGLFALMALNMLTFLRGAVWEPDSQAAAAMEKEQRKPRPAAHEADAAVADRDGRD